MGAQAGELSGRALEAAAKAVVAPGALVSRDPEIAWWAGPAITAGLGLGAAKLAENGWPPYRGPGAGDERK